MAEDRPREAYDGQDITEKHSFDQLARGLASGTVTRGQALKLAGGALLGGLLASIPGVAWAQGERPCPPGTHRCPPGGPCVATGTPCPGGGCPDGLQRCGDTCLDLENDLLNCGGCGHQCPPEAYACEGGFCQIEVCSEGFTMCGSTCVDLQTDPSNCGACGRQCAPGDSCVGGLCQAGSPTA